MSARHMPILNARIEAELNATPQVECAWHKMFYPTEPTPVLQAGNPEIVLSSFCPRCEVVFSTDEYPLSEQHVAMVAEIVAAKKPAPVEVLRKPQEFASQYSTNTNRGEKQIVASRKSEPKFYGAIEI